MTLAKLTYSGTVKGRWRRTWVPYRFRYHLRVAGVWVRVPWIAWVMFS